MVAEILFWTSIFLIFHSYVLFPVFLWLLTRKDDCNRETYEDTDTLPSVTICMAAYNEEAVIQQKIESIFDTNYQGELHLYIGSDNSTDATNQIVEVLKELYPTLQFFPFTSRQGKPGIINQLVAQTQSDIVVITDANVMFDQSTIFELVKSFKDEKIGLVDTHMINPKIAQTANGISKQESAYISREVIIKQQESCLWGAMMGPFGGCYAIRRALYNDVPYNFLVDDFYINMKVLEQGYLAVNNIDANVYEDVSNNLKEEFRRKVRIATGNFQNLRSFAKLLNPFSKSTTQEVELINRFGLAFSFFSHKVIRWLGPVFMLLVLVSNVLLLQESIIYKLALGAYLFSMLIPFIDLILKRLSIHISVVRFVTHFYTMNLALLVGFVKYIKGVKTNVWKPTQRNQHQSV